MMGSNTSGVACTPRGVARTLRWVWVARDH